MSIFTSKRTTWRRSVQNDAKTRVEFNQLAQAVGREYAKKYLELVRRYYGHDQGVTRVDDIIAAEWAYIPHFYLNFYVYQYATSMIGGMSLSEGIIGEQARRAGTATRNRDAYLELLSAGSSKYPIELLKDAGVDMTTSQPFEAAMREMNRIMDEMERIYARGGSTGG